MSSSSYHCLYTKHKTQKRKIWNDGKLIITSTGIVTLFPLSLFDNVIVGTNANQSIASSSNMNHNGSGSGIGGASGTIDSVVISMNEVSCIQNGLISNIETEKFLIQIEGPYKEEQSRNTVNSTNSNMSTKNPSKGMQKLLNRKFKVPQKVFYDQQQVSQQTQQLNNDVYKGRKRPLQPGEWVKQCQLQRMQHQQQNYRSQQQSHQFQHRNLGQNQYNNNHNHNNLPPQPDHYSNRNQPQLPQPLSQYHNPQNQQQQTNFNPNQTCPPNQRNNHYQQFSIPHNGHVDGGTTTTTTGTGQTKSKSTTDNGLISNDFDPSSFYEEEDDDEDENDNEGADICNNGVSNRNVDMNQDVNDKIDHNGSSSSSSSFGQQNLKIYHNNNQLNETMPMCNLTHNATEQSTFTTNNHDHNQDSNINNRNNDTQMNNHAARTESSTNSSRTGQLSSLDLLQLFSIPNNDEKNQQNDLTPQNLSSSITLSNTKSSGSVTQNKNNDNTNDNDNNNNNKDNEGNNTQNTPQKKNPFLENLLQLEEKLDSSLSGMNHNSDKDKFTFDDDQYGQWGNGYWNNEGGYDDDDEAEEEVNYCQDNYNKENIEDQYNSSNNNDCNLNEKNNGEEEREINDKGNENGKGSNETATVLTFDINVPSDSEDISSSDESSGEG
jgi:hypothetical protein